MAGMEGSRPKIAVPLENIGVRGTARRPGERTLTILPGEGVRRGRSEGTASRLARPREQVETAPQRTLLQEMQQYLAERQVLREQGYFTAENYFYRAGREPRIDIPRADAISYDIEAIIFAHSSKPASVPEIARRIREMGSPGTIASVFNVYAIGEMSSERRQRTLRSWEITASAQRKFRRERPLEHRRSMLVTHAEMETTAWLLKQVGIEIDVPEGDVAIPYAELIMETRRRASG